MSTKESCRTCQHCVAGQSSSGPFCRLRQIMVHPDIAIFAFCHHWTKRSPSLPKIHDESTQGGLETQLELGRALVTIDR